MRFALLLYCATVPAETHPAYDCVSLSVHADRQAAINAAHEWCVFDHVCIHHTYLQELELGPEFHHVATSLPHDASKDSAPSDAAATPHIPKPNAAQDPGVPAS